MPSSKLTGFIYLIWSVFMSYYWLILFVDPDFPSWLPLSGSLIVAVLFALGLLKENFRLQKISLGLSALLIIGFSFPAIGSAPACNCYETSIADLLPNLLSLGMIIIVWFTLRL